MLINNNISSEKMQFNGWIKCYLILVVYIIIPMCEF